VHEVVAYPADRLGALGERFGVTRGWGLISDKELSPLTNLVNRFAQIGHWNGCSTPRDTRTASVGKMGRSIGAGGILASRGDQAYGLALVKGRVGGARTRGAWLAVQDVVMRDVAKWEQIGALSLVVADTARKVWRWA